MIRTCKIKQINAPRRGSYSVHVLNTSKYALPENQYSDAWYGWLSSSAVHHANRGVYKTRMHTVRRHAPTRVCTFGAKHTPNGAAVGGPLMLDAMDSNTEQSAQHNNNAAAEAEVEESTSTPGSSALLSPPPSLGNCSVSTAATPTPPVNTAQSVPRAVPNVAVGAGSRVTSGAWLYFKKFDKPVNNRGQNTQCQVKKEDGNVCGRIYKHVSGNGTTPLLEHLSAKHPAEYEIATKSRTKSKETKKKKGEAHAAAAGATSAGPREWLLRLLCLLIFFMRAASRVLL